MIALFGTAKVVLIFVVHKKVNKIIFELYAH